MDVFKHYSNGTTHIDSTGEYHGYLPSRTDKLLDIHINHSGFDIHIDYYNISIRHKYITMVYETSFSVGKWQYSIEALPHYNYGERNTLIEMEGLLRELVNEHTLYGVHVSDYHSLQVINSHRTDTSL
ncbi:hypothetical protein F8O53_00255 [Enterobacter sp. 63]